MKYESDFLTRVILRLDYPTEPGLQGDHEPEVSAGISDRFPFVQSVENTQVSFTVSPDGSGMEQSRKGWNWLHKTHEHENQKVVTVATDFLAIEYFEDQYTNFEEFIDNFYFVFERFQKLYEVEEFSRIGLRYIDEFTMPDGNALDWENLIAKDLITSVNAGVLKGQRVTRSMHQLHTAKDDISVLVNYGIHNPEFPNPVVRRQFILDTDCSVSGGVASSDIRGKIDELHVLTSEVFENSIDDGLREKMGIING
jgi:uncharacterized protein (TIGR04255 family)